MMAAPELAHAQQLPSNLLNLPVDGSVAAWIIRTFGLLTVLSVAPGILIMTVASVALGTAISTATDMTTGIIARFRTMNIARVSVLTGHVLGAVIKTAAAVVIVAAFAFASGFRSDAGPLGWLGVVGLVILIAFSLTWLTVGMGLAADSVETASNTPLFLMILPFVSSGFVPTDAMPTGLRQFAEYQPFTPMINTLRDLVTGAATDSDLWLAIGWFARRWLQRRGKDEGGREGE